MDETAVAGVGAVVGALLSTGLQFLLNRNKQTHDQTSADRVAISSEYQKLINQLEQSLDKLQADMVELSKLNTKYQLENAYLLAEVKVLQNRISYLELHHGFRSTTPVDAHVVLNDTGVILSASSYVEAILHYKSNDLVGNSFGNYVAQDYKKDYDQVMLQIKAGAVVAQDAKKFALTSKAGVNIPVTISFEVSTATNQVVAIFRRHETPM